MITPNRNRWMNRWRALQEALINPHVDDAALESALREARGRHPLPVVWLIGKTQSGKTSIIRALTGSELAEIGNGFQPCTPTARFYDFPAALPLVRFLDTRGLGEVAYDPEADIRFGESQAHLLLGVMKAADVAQDAVFEVLRSVRRRHPEWPLVIAQTGLHELYAPDGEHPRPYPFERSPWPASLPADLVRVLRAQRERGGGIPGTAPVHWVPVDLTLPEDGYEPSDYGLDALWRAIDEVSMLRIKNLIQGDEEVRNLYDREAHPHIAAYALTAAGVGALPLVDLVGVPAIQAKLLQSLGAIYGQRWDARSAAEFLGLLGTGIGVGYLARAAGRTLVKLVPAFGQTLGAVWGAAASGATTYALGKAAGYYFSRMRDGLVTDAAALRRVFAEQLARGSDILRERIRSDRS